MQALHSEKESGDPGFSRNGLFNFLYIRVSVRVWGILSSREWWIKALGAWGLGGGEGSTALVFRLGSSCSGCSESGYLKAHETKPLWAVYKKGDCTYNSI